MNKRLTVALATALGTGALLLGSASPAAAAPPSATTPDGKSVTVREFVGSMYGTLRPASTGDSLWVERRNSTTQYGRVTATGNVAELRSGMTGHAWAAWRACAHTAGAVTCTAYYAPLGEA